MSFEPDVLIATFGSKPGWSGVAGFCEAISALASTVEPSSLMVKSRVVVLNTPSEPALIFSD